MNDLWAGQRENARKRVEPLAVRMRPRTLDEFAGQKHILGPGKLLRRMLEADVITSLILHGPPGTGKTTLAELIASFTKRHFERENASSVGVKRIREIIDESTSRLERTGRRTVLFLDEIHRFTKPQQDVLLADVERGILTLVGATTENPLFAVNSALVSRSTLFRLEPLTEDDIIEVLRRAITDKDRGYGSMDLRVDDDALRVWATKSDGDARRALTALEVAILSERSIGADGQWSMRKAGDSAHSAPQPHSPTAPLHITRSSAEDSIQQKAAVYSGDGDEHYNTISAFIKSVRGSDPDAAIYWLARMLDAGEDPRFVARRLAILASEDIGNADPRGIMVAQSAWELLERIGMPEGRIILAQATTYLALAPKSNASYVAIDEALTDVKEGRTIAVPVHLRDPNAAPPAPGGGPANASGYRYAHADAGAVNDQDYLGVDKVYYRPTDRGAEKAMGERLEELRRLRRGARKGGT
ncbi:MAG TPA: replication-associated recombination protein A [Phycisphaerales bacterium]